MSASISLSGYIKSSGVTVENEPIIKSDGAGAVTQWDNSTQDAGEGIYFVEGGSAGDPLRLGIGVAAPTVALDVTGGIKASGNVSVGGSAATKLLTLKKDGGGSQLGIDIHNSGTAAGDDAVISYECQGVAEWVTGVARSASSFVIAGSGADLATNPRLAISSTGGITTTLTSANTNTAGVALKLDHTTSGSSAVGFGTLIRFDGERTGSTSDGMGTLGFVADSMSASRVDGAFVVNTGLDGTYTERLRVSSAGDITSTNATGSKPVLTLENTANDANSSNLIFTKNRSATNDDILGTVRFKGNNNAGTPEVIEYATIYAQSSTVTDGAEDGKLIIRTMKDGTLGARMTIASDGVAEFSNGINLGDTNLSNYKEGSWTPTLVRNGAAITAGVAYTSANGNYTRVGNVVHYWFDMTIGTLDNSTLAPASGTFGIGGLPFTSAAAGNGGYGAPSFRSMTAVPTSIRNNNNSSFVQGSATYIALFWFNGSAVEIGLDDVTTDLTTGRLTGEGFYFTS